MVLHLKKKRQEADDNSKKLTDADNADNSFILIKIVPFPH